jgi:hypothetical protein
MPPKAEGADATAKDAAAAADDKQTQIQSVQKAMAVRVMHAMHMSLCGWMDNPRTTSRRHLRAMTMYHHSACYHHLSCSTSVRAGCPWRVWRGGAQGTEGGESGVVLCCVVLCCDVEQMLVKSKNGGACGCPWAGRRVLITWMRRSYDVRGRTISLTALPPTMSTSPVS